MKKHIPARQVKSQELSQDSEDNRVLPPSASATEGKRQRGQGIPSNKLIGQVYINVLQDEKGEIKYAWGYDLDYDEIRLSDLAMLNSQLQTWKDKAQQDYNERIEESEKEFSVEKS